MEGAFGAVVPGVDAGGGCFVAEGIEVVGLLEGAGGGDEGDDVALGVVEGGVEGVVCEDGDGGADVAFDAEAEEFEVFEGVVGVECADVTVLVVEVDFGLCGGGCLDEA